MNPSKYTKEEIVQKGEAIYTRRLQALVETEENLGKIIMIDINSEDYAVATTGLEAGKILRERQPDGILCALRIGYTAVETIGGVLPRREKAA